MSSSSELDNDDEEVDLREVESGGFLTLGGSGNNEQEEVYKKSIDRFCLILRKTVSMYLFLRLNSAETTWWFS